MPDETKLLCNRCYNPLTTAVYTEGVYVYPCDCRNEVIDKEWKEVIEEVKEEEFDRGMDAGREEGYEDGRRDAQDDARDRLAELEEKIEEYSQLTEEDEYLDRIGT